MKVPPPSLGTASKNKQEGGGKLTRGVAESPSLEILKSDWAIWAASCVWPCFSRLLDQMISRCPFLPQWFDEVAHSPVLMLIWGEVHYSGFLGQRWFFNYDYYYVLYHREQNKKYVSKVLPWHVSYRHTLCPEYNIIHFSVCTVEHFFFLLPCCKMSGCFSKQAITRKLCLSPKSFLSRIINLFLTFCCMLFLTKADFFFFHLFLWTRFTSSHMKEIMNQLIN